jgi:hypothetical protein
MLVGILAIINLYVACKPDFQQQEPFGSTENCVGCLEEREHLFVRTSNAPSDRDGEAFEIGNRKIALGAKRANPFLVSAMTQAWNTLWPQHAVPTLSPTHLYVRFKPTTLEEYKLLEVFDIPLVTFPLDYEIITSGDWYDDPMVPNDEIPWFYSVVKPDFQFPAVQYEVLDALFLAPMKSELTRRSFSIVEHSTGVSFRDEECIPECQNWPDCLDYPGMGCGDLYLPPPSGGTGGWDPFFPPSETSPPCDPDDPEDIDEYCFVEEEVPYTPTVNACGCTAYGTRNPAGCIRVIDTQLPPNSTLGGTPVHLAGVSNVEVHWWNGWFGFWETETDQNGCWRIPHRDYGVGHMWVKFKNDRATIRGLRGANFWEYAFAVTDHIGQIGGPVFNNISVIYTPTGNDESATKLFWYAATCNNALAEYHGYAAADGIATPPMGLDILLFNHGGGAAAPMFNKTGLNWVLLGAVQHILSGLLGIPILGVPLGTGLQLFVTVMMVWAPDVVYMYGGETMVSDAVKETFYHEFGHASHFKSLNNNSYWNNNIAYVIGNDINNNNSPYGTRGTPGFERCAIIESWGYHIGPDYADRKYGVYHSRTANQLFVERSRWKYVEEPFTPDISGGGLDNFIPKGLCLDLIDNNAMNPPGVVEGLASDPITGFTNLRYFNAISQGSPSLVTQVETNLNTALPPGVTAAMMRAMMAAHGY